MDARELSADEFSTFGAFCDLQLELIRESPHADLTFYLTMSILSPSIGTRRTGCLCNVSVNVSIPSGG
jgi:hypothetical protein